MVIVTCVAGRDVIIGDVVHIKLLRGFLFLWVREVINKLAKIFFEEWQRFRRNDFIGGVLK